MRTIGLCAGIGGIELGLSLVLSVEPVLFVERDPFCQRVLGARWPGVPIGGDVCTDPSGWSGQCDMLTAGFPCQPWSAAGQKKGVEDDRWLWPAILEWVRVVGPRFVFLENVPGLIARGGLGHVLGGLAPLGFDAEWGVFSCRRLGGGIFASAYSSWPTICATDGVSEGLQARPKRQNGLPLRDFVARWQHQREFGPQDGMLTGMVSIPRSNRRLNPVFAEWLMGFPCAWSDSGGAPDCAAWGTACRLLLRRLLGPCWPHGQG